MELFMPKPMRWLQEVLGPVWKRVLGGVSTFGSVWGILLAVGLARWILGRRALYGVLMALIVESVVKKGLAAAVPIARPSGGEVIQAPGGGRRDFVP